MIPRLLTRGLGWILIFLLVGSARAGEWDRFKKDFLSADGRIIDYYQDRHSHSEGQGYGLLLAVKQNDRAAFDLIGTWMKNNLQVRKKDRLLAWSWGRRDDGRWAVIDENNASDGDQLVAWALLLAHEKWGNKEYLDQALEIVRDIREFLVRKKDGLFCLLPGYYGFDADNNLTLNPSYFIFPALKKFSFYDNKDFWEKVYRDSFTLLSKSLVSTLNMPVDWVVFSQGQVKPEAERGKAFGYEAIRTPLYLAWDHHLEVLTGLSRMLDQVDRLGWMPEKFFTNPPGPSPEKGPAGFQAVMALAADRAGRPDLGRKLRELNKTMTKKDKDYYSRVLTLLARMDMES